MGGLPAGGSYPRGSHVEPFKKAGGSQRKSCGTLRNADGAPWNTCGTEVERKWNGAEIRWKSCGNAMELRWKPVETMRNETGIFWNEKESKAPCHTRDRGLFILISMHIIRTCILFPVFYTLSFQERPQRRHQRGGKYRHGHERNPCGNGRDRVQGNSFRVQDWKSPDRNLPGQAFRTIPERVGQPGPGAFKFIEPPTIPGEYHFRRGQHFGEHDGERGDLEGGNKIGSGQHVESVFTMFTTGQNVDSVNDTEKSNAK